MINMGCRFILNKKRSNIKVVGALILFLVLMFILLAGLLNKQSRIMRSSAEEEMCAQSVIEQSKNSALGTGGINLKCPVQKKEIKPGREKEETALYMAKCWHMMGENKLKLFSDVQIGNKNYCVACYELSFDKKSKPVPLSDFIDYLRQEHPPAYISPSIKPNESYFDYLFPDNNGYLDSSAAQRQFINPKVKYVVMLVYSKSGTFRELARKTIVSSAGAGAIGMVAGVGLATLVVITAPISLPAGVIAGAGAIGALSLGSYAGLMTTATAGTPVNPLHPKYNSLLLLYPLTPETLKNIDCDYLPAQQHTLYGGR